MKKIYRSSLKNLLIPLLFSLFIYVVSLINGGSDRMLYIFSVGFFLFFIEGLFHFYEVDDVGISVGWIRKFKTMKWNEITKIDYMYGRTMWRLSIFSKDYRMIVSMLDDDSRKELVNLLEQKAINIKGIDRAIFYTLKK